MVYLSESCFYLKVLLNIPGKKKEYSVNIHVQFNIFASRTIVIFCFFLLSKEETNRQIPHTLYVTRNINY